MYRRYTVDWNEYYREWKVIDNKLGCNRSSHDTYEEARDVCEILNAPSAEPIDVRDKI